MKQETDSPLPHPKSPNQKITKSLKSCSGGQARIRTLEADGNRFTVCPLCPLGYLPLRVHGVFPASKSRWTQYSLVESLNRNEKQTSPLSVHRPLRVLSRSY